MSRCLKFKIIEMLLVYRERFLLVMDVNMGKSRILCVDVVFYCKIYCTYCTTK